MTYVPERLRAQVYQRANNCCEYCRLHEDDNFFSHEVDHIVAEKHRGGTVLGNLCLACFDCNRFKGSDLASLDPQNDDLVRLFNPRTQIWDEHFVLDGTTIRPLTPEGRVTALLLKFNDKERRSQRSVLIAIGRYPCR